MSADVKSIAYYGVDLSYDKLHSLIRYNNEYNASDEDIMCYIMGDFFNNIIEWNIYQDSDYTIGIILPDSASLQEIRDGLTNAANDFWALIRKMFPDMPTKVAIKTFKPRFGVRTQWY